MARKPALPDAVVQLRHRVARRAAEGRDLSATPSCRLDRRLQLLRAGGRPRECAPQRRQQYSRAARVGSSWR
eukprot:scaffold221696_cov26-Tisochrysis_lutea.AAC.1